jgi:transposase
LEVQRDKLDTEHLNLDGTHSLCKKSGEATGYQHRKRGRKRVFYEHLYKTRYVTERTFAWIDSFRTLLIRFDTTTLAWLNWHYLAFALILIKV